MSIEVVLLQPTIDRRQSRKRGIGLLPLPVKQFDRHSRKAADLFQDPLLLLFRKASGFASVRPPFGLESLKASMLEAVIPVFQRAWGDEPRRTLTVLNQRLS